MRKNIILVIVSGVLFITGCSTSSSPTSGYSNADTVKAAEMRAEAEKVRREKEQAQMEESMSKIPDWVLQVPKPDETGIFAIGSGESDKVRVALKKAMLDAEYGLAKNYNQELSGSERSYLQDNAGRTTTQQYTELVDKLVSQVNVPGFEIVRQEVKPIDGKYNAFILMKLPYAQFNKVLQDQRDQAKTNNKAIAEAFDDLGRRLDARRKQRLEDQKAAQDAQAVVLPQPAPAAPVSPVQFVVPITNPVAEPGGN